MPSAARTLLFGDSHLAAAARAVRAAGAEDRFEFWGASGPNFRALEIEDDAVVPMTKAAAAEVARVNGRGRARLEPGAFDRVIMVGGRLRSSDFFVPMARHMMQPAGAVSEAVLAACARRWAGGRGFRLIRHLFPQGGPIAFIPAALRLPPSSPDPDQPRLDKHALTRLRAAADAALSEQGIHLVQQPEASITEDLYTPPAHGADPEAGDVTHVSPAFMGRMLDDALTRLGEPAL